MNLRDMLTKITQLSEGTKETSKGRIHTAEPGGYGRKDDEDDEGKKVKANEPKKKRGGQEKDDGPKFDTPKGDIFGRTSGTAPKGKSGRKITPMKDADKAEKKAEKAEKKGLKEYFDDMDNALNEMMTQQPIPVVGKQGATQQTGAGFLNIDDNSPAGQAMKDAIGKLAQQKKAQIVVPTQGQQSGTQQKPTATSGGATNQPAMAEEGGEKWIQKAIKHPGALRKKLHAKPGEPIPAGKLEKATHSKDPKTAKQARLAQTLRGLKEADIPSDQSDMGAGLGAGRSQATFEGKKPDFLDLDKDGNKKESMKKAAADKKKKKVDESMDTRLKAAHQRGKAHALSKESYNCKYDDMEEARMYHEGYKEGLDECYGQVPISGVVGENSTVDDMASYGAHTPSLTDEGNAFTAALAKTPSGQKFSVAGKTYKDTSDYDSEVNESPFAFEAWDRELNALLTESEQVDEGMTVSISKGQQGQPDSVTVSAQDGEADQLLAAIKQAGLGLFGSEQHQEPTSSSMSLQPSGNEQEDNIDVVGDHDGMMTLIKKVTSTAGEPDTGSFSADSDEDYEEEGGEEVCDSCGHADCGCDESVEETETVNQAEEEVAEDNAPDTGAEEFSSMDAEIAQDNSAASSHGGAENSNFGDDSEEEQDNSINEWANDVGRSVKEEIFTTDADFMINDITSGLNKRKSTGQTTVPVVAGQVNRMQSHSTTDVNESILDWKKLAGLK